MPEVRYGNKTIIYAFEKKDGLRHHYIVVDRHNGVVLRGKAVSPEQADKLILKKAIWILKKLELVRAIKEKDIVTGSRIPYLGRRYYAEIYYDESQAKTKIEFNHSKFRITVNRKEDIQPLIQQALHKFYKAKAIEKITPRLKKWSEHTGLAYNELRFRTMDKRWGSCTPANNIHINIEAIKLPFTLIDYLLVHELVHTVHKNHSKTFWAELSKHMPNWKELDSKMDFMKF